MKTKVTATLTEKGLSLVVNGDPHAINKSHLNYSRILEALREGDYDKVPDLIDVTQSVKDFTEGLVTIIGGAIFYAGEELHNSVTDRMLQMLRLGLDIRPLARFLSRLMNNPSNSSVTQLYNFLEACDLPITEDGRVLCYKSVNDDYWDTYTGKTFMNTVGSVIEMPRNKVNDNPDQTCSHGLHVCSQAYGMFGRRLMLVAVDPADVVSVPRDYNQAKMRCCKYEVLKEVTQEGFDTYEDEPVYDNDEIEWIEDEEVDDDSGFWEWS
jgi:hypothetical protein